MSKILKASNINIDKTEIISIDNYNYIENTKEEKLEGKLNVKEKIKKVNEQAELIILEARRNAISETNKIMKDAFKKIEEEKEKIYQKSQEEGYENGLKAAEEEINTKKNELTQKIKENLELRDNTLVELEKEIVQFVIELTQKILTKSFELNPEIIKFLVQKGLTQVKNFEDLKIYVSEEQYDFVEQNKNEILGIDTKNYKIKIIKDTTLKNSECLIETNFGTINSSFTEQFESIKNTMALMLD